MKKRMTTALAAALAMSMAIPAFAARIEHREQIQQKRIHQGVRNGSLTKGEAARLERQQLRTDRMKRRFRADGKFTRRERARVHHRLHHASRHICRAKYNRRGAW